MADPIQVLREHIPDDYLGPDSNDQFSGERYGQHPEALAALAQVEALVEAAGEILAAIETNSEKGAPQYLYDALAPFKENE